MPPHHVSTNRDHWNDMARDWIAAGEKAWATNTPYWGIWELPEADLALLPPDMNGMHAIELGCGTGYVSGWMTHRGATVTAIDISSEQLATARRLAAQHGADITFLEGNAEAVDRPDGSFDFAVSEYGAAIWCDPHLWLPEAYRLLRPGGELVFLGHHPLTFCCSPDDGPVDRALHRPYRDMKVADWTTDAYEPGGIEFNLTMAGWMDLFREIGFEVTRYQELYAPQSATGEQYALPADWSKDFPCEQVWHLRKPG